MTTIKQIVMIKQQMKQPLPLHQFLLIHSNFQLLHSLEHQLLQSKTQHHWMTHAMMSQEIVFKQQHL